MYTHFTHYLGLRSGFGGHVSCDRVNRSDELSFNPLTRDGDRVKTALASLYSAKTRGGITGVTVARKMW